MALEIKKTHPLHGCFNFTIGSFPVEVRFVHLNLPPYLTTGFELQRRHETIKKTIDLIFYGDLKFLQIIYEWKFVYNSLIYVNSNCILLTSRCEIQDLSFWLVENLLKLLRHCSNVFSEGAKFIFYVSITKLRNTICFIG